MAIHHKIPRSRGGTDDEWNLIEYDDYTHAYEHALDFILFPEAPMFDFRQAGWPLLPLDLQLAVKAEMKNRETGLHKLHKEKLPDGRSKSGVEIQKNRHAQKLENGCSQWAIEKSLHRRKKITLQNINTRELLYFDGVHEASRELNLTATLICKVLKGKRNHHGGFRVWYT